MIPAQVQGHEIVHALVERGDIYRRDSANAALGNAVLSAVAGIRVCLECFGGVRPETDGSWWRCLLQRGMAGPKATVLATLGANTGSTLRIPANAIAESLAFFRQMPNSCELIGTAPNAERDYRGSDEYPVGRGAGIGRRPLFGVIPRKVAPPALTGTMKTVGLLYEPAGGVWVMKLRESVKSPPETAPPDPLDRGQGVFLRPAPHLQPSIAVKLFNCYTDPHPSVMACGRSCEVGKVSRGFI